LSDNHIQLLQQQRNRIPTDAIKYKSMKPALDAGYLEEVQTNKTQAYEWVRKNERTRFRAMQLNTSKYVRQLEDLLGSFSLNCFCLLFFATLM